MIVLLLEATRRSVGWPLPIIAIVLMVYALYGPALPGILAHPGNTWKSVVNHLYLTSQGIFGIALGVVATYVFHYVLFGVLATRVGLGRFFIDLATALTGRFSGGPAKVSIFGSALFGMISGSSIANTVTVGSLTIPAMIRIGYARHFAGAVGVGRRDRRADHAADHGRGRVPDGGVPRRAVPDHHPGGDRAGVHAFLRRVLPDPLRGEEARPARPAARRAAARARVIRRDWPTRCRSPCCCSVLFSGFTPYLAAYWGITGCIVLGLTNRNPVVAIAFVAAVALVHPAADPDRVVGASARSSRCRSRCRRGTPCEGRSAARRALIDVLDAFVIGAKYAISVGAAAATVGIIIGIVTLTGVGFKLSTIITGARRAISAALLGGSADAVRRQGAHAVLHAGDDGGRVHPARLRHPDHRQLLIMVTIAAPALAMLGVPQLVSHFFVFYYGVLADITPPVALAAYAGASMAGADPFRTGNTAFRLGLAKALVPFVFVYSPSMLLVTKGFTWAEFFETTGGCIIGIVMLAAALTGYGLARMPTVERLWLGAASVLVISPSRTATLVGLAMAVPVLLRQFAAWRGAPVRVGS